MFPFVPLGWDEQNPKKWTLNQVWDFHLDWTDDAKSILIIIEEFENIEDNWKQEIIRDYFTASYDQETEGNSWLNFQLILTLPQFDSDLMEKVINDLGLRENEKRTQKQVIEGKLLVVDLDLE